jgi:GT2 family glycosyltransferase
MQDIGASVVIPTRGRPELLARCLNALCRQTIGFRSYEIVVVDDGPSRDTHAVVQDCADRMAPQGLSVVYVASNGPHGPAAARNRGWRRARADIVAFTDDDTEPDANWLEAGLAAFEPGTDAVTGRLLMPLPASPTDYEMDASCLTRSEFVTANCFCRKATLIRLDGFDERFPLAWREDSDLQFRMLRLGTRIAHAPGALVVHPIRPAGWGVSLRQQRKIMFDALLYRKHRALYRARIRRTPRWDYYAAVASLALIALGLASGTPSVVVGSAGMWAGITGGFALRRLRHTSRAPRHIAEMILTSALIPPLAIFWRIMGALKYRTWLA